MSWESMKPPAFLHLSMWLLALGLHDKPHRLSGEFVQSASILGQQHALACVFEQYP